MSKSLHHEVRRSRKSPKGQHALSLGLRLGYWPCLGGPFIAVDFGSRRLEIWYGRPTYRRKDWA